MVEVTVSLTIEPFDGLRAQITFFDVKERSLKFLILQFPQEIETFREIFKGANPQLLLPVNFENDAIQAIETCESQSLLDTITKASQGLKFFQPELCSDGVNGTYFLKDPQGNRVAVFKPHDEELNAINNPKKMQEDEEADCARFCGIFPGEASRKEVAAFLLDREGYYGVPPTGLVKINQFGSAAGDKIGSLQTFVEADGSVEDIGPNVFPAEEVHKIAILDLQMLNLDRHVGNILFNGAEDAYTLTPIDHGFALPDTLSGNNIWFEWMNWKQAKEPLSLRFKDYIERIDPDRDAEELETRLGIRPECTELMKISVELLKCGVRNGLTLFQIGRLVCSNGTSPSVLESLIQRARSICGEDKVHFLSTASQLVAMEIDKIATSN